MDRIETYLRYCMIKNHQWERDANLGLIDQITLQMDKISHITGGMVILNHQCVAIKLSFNSWIPLFFRLTIGSDRFGLAISALSLNSLLGFFRKVQRVSNSLAWSRKLAKICLFFINQLLDTLNLMISVIWVLLIVFFKDPYYFWHSTPWSFHLAFNLV